MPERSLSDTHFLHQAHHSLLVCGNTKLGGILHDETTNRKAQECASVALNRLESEGGTGPAGAQERGIAGGSDALLLCTACENWSEGDTDLLARR